MWPRLALRMLAMAMALCAADAQASQATELQYDGVLSFFEVAMRPLDYASRHPERAIGLVLVVLAIPFVSAMFRRR